MARPLWKGFISFGLVLIPVVLYSAQASEARLDLDLIDARDSGRVRYKRVNERTGKEVEWSQIAKGYKLADGSYVTVTDDDFKRAAAGVTKGIEILEFVDRDTISPWYFDKPYFVQPGKGGEKVYALLRDTLTQSRRAGLAKVVIQSRQHLGVLLPHDDKKTLVLMTIRFAQELRSPEEAGPPPAAATAKVSQRELDLAANLVEEMSADFDPAKYRDEYLDTLRRFIEEKAASGGHTPPGFDTPDEHSEPPQVDVVELLRRSVETRARAHKPARAAAPRKVRTHSASRRKDRK